MGTALTPIEVFCSYTEQDDLFLQELETHLSVLQREGLISLWHRRQIVPGTNWAEAVDQQLEQASIILLLMSADFLASDYCYQVEMRRALERHKAGEAQVIPIVVRPCDWSHTLFATLQHLPRGKKAVTLWDNRDLAWNNVTIGIRQAIGNLRLESISNGQPRLASSHGAVPHILQKPKLSSRQSLKLLLSFLLIVFIVAMAGGGFWFWIAHSQTSLQSSHQGTPQIIVPPANTPESTGTIWCDAFLTHNPAEAVSVSTPRLKTQIQRGDFSFDINYNTCVVEPILEHTNFAATVILNMNNKAYERQLNVVYQQGRWLADQFYGQKQ